jgi:outer membrane biosynthesis protein TonB
VQTDAAGNTSAATTTDYTLGVDPAGERVPPGAPPAPPPSQDPVDIPEPSRPAPAPAERAEPAAATAEVTPSKPAPAPVQAQPSPVADRPGPEPARAPARPRQAPRQPAPENPNRALEVLAEVAGKVAFPAALALVVLLFLAIQDRIDRNDPKLALAPIRSEPLDFIDPL